MKYALRDYQQDLIEQVFHLWSESDVKRVLAQLPTGGGKTVIFTSVAHQFTSRQKSVLVLAHREELLLQAQEKLEHVTGQPVGLIKAGYKEKRQCAIQVASVASLVNRESPPADLIIVDEAHHSTANTYQQLLDRYPEAYVLGVTATPARIDGQGFKFVYDRLVIGPSVQTLVDRGFLSKFKLFAAPQTVNTQGVKTTAGDYNARQLAQAVDTSIVMGDLIDAWHEFAPGKQTVVFAVNVDHSKAIAQAYSQAGIPAEHLDGETPDRDRRATLERFRAGEITVLSNCGLFSEGFDLPSIEAVQCVRPTQSLVFWLQMVGRSLRVHPNKEYAVVIDHTENWAIHGAPTQPRNWSLEPVSLQGGRWNVVCPECHHVFKPLSHEQKPDRYEWCAEAQEYKMVCCYTCPNCGESMEMERWEGEGEPPMPRDLANDARAEIWQIPLDCDLQILGQLYRLVGFQRKAKRNFTLQWLCNRMVADFPQIGEAELRECALLMGLDEEWAAHWATQTFRKRFPERWAQMQEEAEAEEKTEKDVETEVDVVTVDVRAEHSAQPKPTQPNVSSPEIDRPKLPPSGVAQTPKTPQTPSPTNNATRSGVRSNLSSPALPQLPNFRSNLGQTPSSNSSSNSSSDSTGVTPKTYIDRPMGQLGRWQVQILQTQQSGMPITRIEYISPKGDRLQETLKGWLRVDYHRRIAQIEASLRSRRGK
ncbi:MAG: DEAD/DEAH box helicase [Cyanobacteriota bacterium]|nr:DEAD/DEAH box helicase [Cyanobacteriota bacterium]